MNSLVTWTKTKLDPSVKGFQNISDVHEKHSHDAMYVFGLLKPKTWDSKLGVFASSHNHNRRSKIVDASTSTSSEEQRGGNLCGKTNVSVIQRFSHAKQRATSSCYRQRKSK